MGALTDHAPSQALAAWWPLALALAALAGAALSSRRRGRSDAPRARPFLTGNEREFLGRLERALPEARIHAQVAMSALLDGPMRGRGRRGAARALAARSRFDRKVVDYVVQDRVGGGVVCVVELDDRTHLRSRDTARDAMMAAAGYRTVRFESRAKPDGPTIRRAVLGDASPRR